MKSNLCDFVKFEISAFERFSFQLFIQLLIRTVGTSKKKS